jgi:hypothetical protein
VKYRVRVTIFKDGERWHQDCLIEARLRSHAKHKAVEFVREKHHLLDKSQVVSVRIMAEEAAQTDERSTLFAGGPASPDSK